MSRMRLDSGSILSKKTLALVATCATTLLTFCTSQALGQAKTNVVCPVQNVSSAKASPNVQPGGGGCGGGGGGQGGGGTGSSGPGVGLSWSGAVNESQPIGGAPARFGLSATVFKGAIWGAYTSTQTIDSQGDADLIVGNSTNPGPLLNLSTVTSNTGVVTAGTGNPAIGTLDGLLYVAQADYFGSVVFLTSGDGANWSNYNACADHGMTGSVTMTPFNGSMYVAMENAADQSLTLCVIPDQVIHPGAYPTTQNFPNINMSFVAGMTTYTPPGGLPTLYIAYASSAANANHNLYYYTTTDGVNFNYSAAAAGDQSSTTPSLASHRGYLYMGFRSNDGSHGFLTKVSTDGVNWSSYTNNGDTMGGPPALVGTGDNAYYPGQSNAITGPYSGYLYNLFVANDSSQVLYTQSTP